MSLRALLLYVVLVPGFACSPRCNQTCTTGTCQSTWTANFSFALEEPNVAYHCDGAFYTPDCSTSYTCYNCIDGCSVGGNCAYHWLFQDYDRASTLCFSKYYYNDYCSSSYSNYNCRYGVNRQGACLYTEQVQTYDRANHCGASYTYLPGCSTSYTVSGNCNSGSDKYGWCYGWFAFSNTQSARQCSNGFYLESCSGSYSISLANCRSVADRTGSCYSYLRRPNWGSAQCRWGLYTTGCSGSYYVSGNCRSVASRDGNCYLYNVVPDTFFNFHCDWSITSGCSTSYPCSCQTGPCVNGANRCWSPPTTCAVTCWQGCDELGMCTGWNLYSDPQPASHCAQGFWGYACQNSCPIACTVPGCTAGGLCINHEKNLFGKPLHCRTGWGDACQNPCPAACRNGCDNDGACVGWDRVIHEGAVFANATCTNGMWGSYCDKTCPTTCVRGCMADGKCVGWWSYSGPAESSLHCTKGSWGHSCQVLCAACPNGCSPRGHCLPFFRLAPRDQIASHCSIPTRKYGADCDLSCSASCPACRNDGFCVGDPKTPICGRCAADVRAGCPGGVCPGYVMNQSLPTWCLPGFWDPACSSICPANCLQGCDNLGHCIGWTEPPLNSTSQPTYCVTGFYGKECALPCSMTCNCTTGNATCVTGCTESGQCLGWESFREEVEANHCFDGCTSPYICDDRGFYGARCELSCPDNCAQDSIWFSHCTGTGKCIGWNNYSAPQTDLVAHCKVGWFGPRCENYCPQFCLNGCTVQGFCLGFENVTAVSAAAHCQEGYYGAKCEYRCPQSCCQAACTGTGKCLGWESRLVTAYEPARHCLSNFYGDYCRFKLTSTKCAQTGCTNGGFCIGVLEGEEATAMCAAGYRGTQCTQSCTGGCPSCGYCGNRLLGSVAPICNAYAPGPPSVPRNVYTDVGNHIIQVYWDPPLDDGNLTVWGYEAEVDGPAPTSNFCGTNGSACPGPPIVLGLSGTTIPNFVPLDVKLRARNEGGPGPKAILHNVMCFPPGPRPLGQVPVNATSMSPQSIQLLLSGTVVWGSNPRVFELISLNNSATIVGGSANVTLVPEGNDTRLMFGLQPDTLKERDVYIVKFNGNAVDQGGFSGFDMNAQQLTWQFRAADSTPPDLATLKPARNSSQTLIGSITLEIVFTEPVEITSVAVVTIVYLDPAVNFQPVVRQTRHLADLKFNGRTNLQVPLSIAALHASSSQYCAYIGAASVRDQAPDSNSFVGVTGPQDARAWCFQTTSVIPSYMQTSSKPALLSISLFGLSVNQNSVSEVEQFKVNLLFAIGLAAGLSDNETLARLSVARLTPTANGNGTVWKAAVDCLPASSSSSVDASTVMSIVTGLVDDKSSMWYTDARMSLVQMLAPNTAVRTIYVASQSLHIDSVTAETGVTVQLSAGVESGLLYVYVVVVNPMQTQTPTTAQEVVKLLNDPAALCSISLSPPELVNALESGGAVSFSLELKCPVELLSSKKYVLVAAASSRRLEGSPFISSVAVPAAVDRYGFIVSSSFAAVTIVGALIWVLAFLLFGANKCWFSRSRASDVFGITEVMDLITDSLYLGFLISFDLSGLAIVQALSIVVPIVFNIGIVTWVLLGEMQNPSFAAKVSTRLWLVAPTVVVAWINPSSLGLLSSQLFNLKFFDAPLSEDGLARAERFGSLTGLLENITQVIIVAIAGTTLGVFDLQSQFTLAMSVMQVLALLVQAILRFALVGVGKGSIQQP